MVRDECSGGENKRTYVATVETGHVATMATAGKQFNVHGGTYVVCGRKLFNVRRIIVILKDLTRSYNNLKD